MSEKMKMNVVQGVAIDIFSSILVGGGRGPIT